MMTKADKISQTIGRIVLLDWLRAIACLMVLLVHASECVYSNDYSFSFPSESGRWSVCLINGLMRPAVPLFLMASAYLLVPLKTNTQTFFRKRFVRVVVPFVVWLIVYATVPVLWGEYTTTDVYNNLTQIFINFIPRASHLWFVYMLIGIYLIMPILSSWLAHVERREEEFYLGLWLFTTLFWHAHEQFGDIFGECWWNPFPLFHYVSGYVGYIVLAHYIRNYLDWSVKKTFYIALPCFLLGYAYCAWSFYTRSFTVEAVHQLEMSWQTTSIAPVMMSFGAFMLIKKVTCAGNVYRYVQDVSIVSYGIYLMHMLLLPFVYSWCNSTMPVAAAIISTAVITYTACYVVSRFISSLKFGNFFIG